jgi:signal peptidase I
MVKLRKFIGYFLMALFAVFAVSMLVLSLPMSGWRALSVQTGSMRPTINPGALVLVHRVPADSLHIGDVITYSSRVVPGETITHRIVAFKQLGSTREIIVKGDANKVADPPLTSAQVVGKVVKHVPFAGKIIDALHKPLGILLLIYVPALLIVAYEIKLLVHRLTKLELDKQTKGAGGREQADGSKPTAEPPRLHAVSKPIHEPSAHPDQKKRLSHRPSSIDGIRIVLLLVLLGSVVGATYSLLNSKATLGGSTITTVKLNQ